MRARLPVTQAHRTLKLNLPRLKGNTCDHACKIGSSRSNRDDTQQR
jgi:hypothetical protein